MFLPEVKFALRSLLLLLLLLSPADPRHVPFYEYDDRIKESQVGALDRPPTARSREYA